MAFPIRYPAPPAGVVPSAQSPAWQGTLSQAPSVAPPPASAAPQPQGPGVGSKLLVEMLPALLGGMAPRGGSAFMRGMQRAQQEKLQRQQLQGQTAEREQSMAIRQQEMALRQQTMEAAQIAARQKAEQARVEAYQSVVARLSDPSVDTPEAYDAAEQEMLAMAPLIGVEPGAVSSLRSRFRTTTRFEKAKAKKILDNVAKLYPKGSIAEIVADADPLVEGKPLSEWVRINGQELPRRSDGSVYAPKAEEPDAFGNSDLARTYRRYRAAFVAKNNREPTAEEDVELDHQARESTKIIDPTTAEISALRRDILRNTANAPRADLPPATQRRVDMKTRAFDSQPVVKRIQTMAEAVTFAEGMDDNTKNPADDQALIYAFAKAMDPDSVVREGEYATVQKYAQSWAESFGFNAQRIFSNTTFLTAQARKNMKTTIRSRFAAAQPQYENLRTNYARQIDQITGGGDGGSYLVDYAAAFPDKKAARDVSSRPAVGSRSTTPDGRTVEIIGYTDDGKARVREVR